MGHLSLEIINRDCHYQINIDKRLSLITGDSATGKSNLVAQISRKSATQIICNMDVIVFVTKMKIIGYSNTCFICDLDMIESITDIKTILSVQAEKDNIYFILLGRSFIKSLPLSIDAIYDFKTVRGITENVQRYSLEMEYIIRDRVDCFITEDSKSGYEFIKQCESKTESLNGASNYIKVLDRNCLLFLDSLGFGGYIVEFLSRVKRKNIQYILWPSFEYFLYHYVFNGANDNVDGLNLEEAYEKALHDITVGHYSKTNGCCGTNCYKCSNSCKHNDCRSILYSVYPELKDKVKQSTQQTTLQQIINKMSGE